MVILTLSNWRCILASHVLADGQCQVEGDSSAASLLTFCEGAMFTPFQFKNPLKATPSMTAQSHKQLTRIGKCNCFHRVFLVFKQTD